MSTAALCCSPAIVNYGWSNYATSVYKQSTTVGNDPTTVAKENLVHARVSRADANDFDDDAVCN